MASTTKIKVNLDGIPTLTRKQELNSLMFGNGIHFLRIIDARNGYIVLPKTLTDADKIMSPEFRQKLKSSGFDPQMPLETKAKMTIVVKKVDSYITSHSNEEIKEELVRQLSLQIDEVYKMPQHGIVKIRFHDIQTAKKIKDQGLILYNYSINPAQIEEERFTRVIQCMNCYEYGHTKGKCTKKNAEKCDRCGQTGHREYSNQTESSCAITKPITTLIMEPGPASTRSKNQDEKWRVTDQYLYWKSQAKSFERYEHKIAKSPGD
ncbi:uncharacterized protein LOC122261154 [Penaeus japonicus]|uniref:uncharacterized protein LOC122261154 n=1 Tax=Penaeus japonicus TaxID=27405 RepID=UPI001C713A90|nr:uncharacterized protein LOC122261154 [Penaeus japonicus]